MDIGLLTPLACGALIGIMVNVIAGVHLKNGYWNQNQGFEYPFVLMAVGVAVAFGPGRYSLDHSLGWALQGGGWGLFAIVLGVLSGLVVELYRHHALADDQQPPTYSATPQPG